MEQNNNWHKVRKMLINKYAITLYVFAVVMIFIGDQSLLNQVSRSIDMREMRRTIEQTKAETAISERVLNSLEHPDSLEQFAREMYKMHAEGEVVYVVE